MSWAFDVAARTLCQEVRGEPLDGQQAVAYTIKNRLASGRRRAIPTSRLVCYTSAMTQIYRPAYNDAVLWRVPLTRGIEALIDECDVAAISANVWHVNAFGYAIRFKKHLGKSTVIWMHREIMRAKPGQVVDHINGNKADNRRANLRLCSHAENCRNKSKPGKPYGVNFHTVHKRWRAYLKKDGKTHHLGMYATMDEAIAARRVAEKKLFGRFAPK